MIRHRGIKGLFLYLVVFLTIGLLSGCFVMPHSYTYGTPIKDEMVAKIQPGKTTKEEIIQWFGIPNNIVKSQDKVGSSYNLPASSAHMTVPSFDLFSSKHKITDDSRIYVYTFSKTSGSSVNILFLGNTTTHTRADTLLVLLNEDTGLVEDSLFRKE